MLADLAYDSRENFNFLEAKGIGPGIKVKRGASGKARGSWALRCAVREFLRDEDKWKRKVSYGRRWAAEGIFSNLKRTFGEFVTAHKFKNMTRELVLKAFCYNLLMNLSALRASEEGSTSQIKKVLKRFRIYLCNKANR